MLKGKTKIELTDVHTGAVEVIEEENMVTNALQYIFNPMGYVKAADPMFTAEYVYDFDTAEGNGTIACVALTHAFGGYSNRGCEEAPARGLYPYYKSIGAGLLRYTGGNSDIGAYDRTLTNSTYGNGYKWIIKVNGITDSVYYFSMLSSTSVKLWRYRANIKTISLFDAPGSARTLLDTEEVSFSQAIIIQYFSYNYDEETDKLYIISAAGFYVANNGVYYITEIDLVNGNAVRQYQMNNKCGSNMHISSERDDCYCYRGYVYFLNYGYSTKYYIYRQEIENSANIQKIAEEVRNSYPVAARDGRIYYELPSTYNGSYCCYIVNTDAFTMKIPETFVVYGYLKDEEDRNKLVIDTYASEVVRAIFKWKLEGISQGRIADKLNMQGVLCPMEYKIYDYYSKDLSVKVKTAKYQKMKQGKYLGGHVPYGLMKDPKDKHKLIIDPEARYLIWLLLRCD